MRIILPDKGFVYGDSRTKEVLLSANNRGLSGSRHGFTIHNGYSATFEAGSCLIELVGVKFNKLTAIPHIVVNQGGAQDIELGWVGLHPLSRGTPSIRHATHPYGSNYLAITLVGLNLALAQSVFNNPLPNGHPNPILIISYRYVSCIFTSMVYLSFFVHIYQVVPPIYKG